MTYPLRKEGYDVIPALDGREALERLREDNFDLVVLDVMLPRMDGFDVCRAIRSRSTVPIIMLTAKTEETDKVLGLELGADDYITKPFSMREFRSRVKAVLRRAELCPARRQVEEPIDAGELQIDFDKRRSWCAANRCGSPTSSSRSSPRWRARRGACSAARCCSSGVWGDAAYRDPRTIDVHIRHLREKLEAEPKTPELILTVRGSATTSATHEPTSARSGTRLAFIFFLGHRAGVRGDLVRVVPQLESEPQGAAARQPATRRRRPGQASSCRSAAGSPPRATTPTRISSPRTRPTRA